MENEGREKIRMVGSVPPLRIFNKNESLLKMILRDIPYDLVFDVIKKMAQVEKIEFEDDGITRIKGEHGEFLGRRVIDYGIYRIVADRTDANYITIISAYNKAQKDSNIGQKAVELSSCLMSMITRSLKASDITTIKRT